MRPLPQRNMKLLDRYGLGVSLLLSLIVAYVFLGGNLHHKNRITKEREELTERLAYLTDLSNTLGEGEDALRTLQASLDDMEKQLPESMEFESFYASLSAYAQLHELSIVAVHPQESIERGQYIELPIAIEARGELDALNQFIYDLLAGERLCKLSSLSVSTSEELGICDVDMTVAIYAGTSPEGEAHDKT